MKDELLYIGKKIVKNKYELANNVLVHQNPEYIQKLKNTNVPENKVNEWRAELIQYLGEALFEEQHTIVQQIKDWATSISEIAIEQGIPLDETLKTLAIYRTVIWDVFTEELKQKQFAAITMLDVSKIINPLLDEISFILSHIYVEHNIRTINIAQTALQELSVPVVPIAAGIAVLPIIGEIDTHRAKLIMEVSLEKSSNLQLQALIIDISGVPMIDTMVAHNLFQIVNALRLIGVKATLTGIRPEIAHTVVSLGVQFNEVTTRANLQQALAEIGFTQTILTK